MAPEYLLPRGGEAWSSRESHKLENVGSNPTRATIEPMNTVFFLFRCWRSLRLARASKRVVYWAVCETGGVPSVTLIVATDRQAWKVSQLALDLLE